MSSWPDAVNGAFEALAGLSGINNCRTLYRDKKVRGVSKASTAFFVSWGIWNLFYYPHLGQWISFVGGLFITVTNSVWLGMMIWYTWRKRHGV